MNSVGLRPLRYQFASPCRDPYDDNWLIIAGEVTTPGGSWSFAEPCLLTDEARSIPGWLRAVAAGRVQATDPDPEGGSAPALSFMEPCLAFSLADRDDDGGAVVRVHLSLEAAPPWQQDEEAEYLYEFTVDVHLDTEALLGAADGWSAELSPFPVR